MSKDLNSGVRLLCDSRYNDAILCLEITLVGGGPLIYGITHFRFNLSKFGVDFKRLLLLVVVLYIYENFDKVVG